MNVADGVTTAELPSDSPVQLIVDGLLAALRQERVTYFPIRHHSPACARHVAHWIRQHRPSAVLIEGPESMNGFIDLLSHPDCRMPVACYTNFVDLQQRLTATKYDDRPHAPVSRHAAYFPLCDHSPELTALRTGRALQARLRFIDLDFAEKILHSHEAISSSVDSGGLQVDSLSIDPHLAFNAYTSALASRLGCRDFNELWDHLFESHGAALATDEFMDRVATFCAMARITSDPDTLQRDGTHVREACMAAAIHEELEANRTAGELRPILVVTGGFHTVALPTCVAAAKQRPRRPAFKEGETGTWLIRYSFDRLDALAGYASGMPSPAFYDRLWQAEQTADPGASATELPQSRAVADIITEVRHLTRSRELPSAASTADAVAAVQMAEQLARLRGHAWPQREDVLDGIRACFVKGEMQADGQSLMALVRQLLAGDRIGCVPPGAGVPPIVEDFHRLARQYRLSTESLEPRALVLDLYRTARHRDISRILHRLDLLEVSFAHYVAGPDFAHGTELERMTEEWRMQWTPATESGLIDVAVYGSSIEEAALRKLLEQVAALTQVGEQRSASAAVRLLVRACRMGLHDHLPHLLGVIEQHISGDFQLPSLSGGLAQLRLLQEAREPLEATQLQALPRLMQLCFQRACMITRDTYHCPPELIEATIQSFGIVREILAEQTGDSTPSVR